MTDYGKLLPRIWTDPEFTALNARSQQVYVLLLSYPTTNLAGVLPLTLKRWAGATADATVDNITTALQRLAAAKFIVVDWDTEEVLIRTYIRNDGVFKQPNLMKSALKAALKTASVAIRFALRDELVRLEMPKSSDLAAWVADETVRVANALVDGLMEPFAEGFADGFAEPMPEGCIDSCTYVGGVRVQSQSQSQPQRSTFNSNSSGSASVADRVPELPDAAAATPGAELVGRIIPREHPDAVKTALRIRASELINTGTERETVEAALHLWLTKPHLGPNTLPSLVSEVIKARGAALNCPQAPSTVDRKVAGWLEMPISTPPPPRMEIEQ